MTNVQKPCPNCPFSRSVTPGALGGSSPEVYIGQIHGPFILPCHMHYESSYKSREEFKAKCLTSPQCAGAAIFRANIKVDKNLPRELHRLPSDTDTVFSSYAEFYSHHAGISLYEAEKRLQVNTPSKLLAIQLARQDNAYLTKG